MGGGTSAVLSEWLRSLTRNQMGSARTGSNPVDRDLFYIFKPYWQILILILTTLLTFKTNLAN